MCSKYFQVKFVDTGKQLLGAKPLSVSWVILFFCDKSTYNKLYPSFVIHAVTFYAYMNKTTRYCARLVESPWSDALWHFSAFFREGFPQRWSTCITDITGMARMYDYKECPIWETIIFILSRMYLWVLNNDVRLVQYTTPNISIKEQRKMICYASFQFETEIYRVEQKKWG